MYHQWKEISIWPPQELVRYFAPSGFKSTYLNTRVIIDGTECPVKKPSNPKSQQATFSTYKNRNTIKVLVIHQGDLFTIYHHHMVVAQVIGRLLNVLS